MKYQIYVDKNDKPKEILSRLIEAILHHVPYASEDSLKEYIKGCYEDIYRKNGKMHKSREKELEYVLKQTGLALRMCFYERYQRGFETAAIVGMKRTQERDTSMMKTKGRPKKRSHK